MRIIQRRIVFTRSGRPFDIYVQAAIRTIGIAISVTAQQPVALEKTFSYILPELGDCGGRCRQLFLELFEFTISRLVEKASEMLVPIAIRLPGVIVGICA